MVTNDPAGDTTFNEPDHLNARIVPIDMTEQDWTDLIDQSLLGTISPESRGLLENRMATDPDFAEEVRRSQAAYHVILHERHRRLKQKMVRWDRDLFFSSRWGILVCIAGLLVCILAWGFGYYNPKHLANRHFEVYHPAALKQNFESGPHDVWEKADATFQRREYERAILLYADLAASLEGHDQQMAQWNILLSRLALTGPTPRWHADLEHFSRTADASFQKKVRRLRRSLDHPLNRFFIRGLRIHGGGFSPKII